MLFMGEINQRYSQIEALGSKKFEHSEGYEMIQIHDYHASCKIRLSKRKFRGHPRLAIISIALILYIITCHSMALLLNSDNNNNKSERPLRATPSSLIPAVSASPEPEPTAPRPMGARAHREPPLNGSIFGKRSVAAQSSGKSRDTPTDPNTKYQQQQPNDIPTLTSAIFNTNQRAKIHSQPMRSSLIKKFTDDMERSEASIHYEDMITQTIEDFLAKNTENDPRKASESFCRMIVIECGRLLSRQANIRRDTYPKSGTRLSTVN